MTFADMGIFLKKVSIMFTRGFCVTCPSVGAVTPDLIILSKVSLAVLERVPVAYRMGLPT